MPIKPDQRLVVVGDMHGCFETLARLCFGDEQAGVTAVGFPGDEIDGRTNVYVFNGDFVDRGGSGYQIIFTLCLFLLVWPEYTYLNRGNHETSLFGASLQPGMGYKFLNEVRDKFPQADMVMIQQ